MSTVLIITHLTRGRKMVLINGCIAYDQINREGGGGAKKRMEKLQPQESLGSIAKKKG
jgi:hypothetical protein